MTTRNILTWEFTHVSGDGTIEVDADSFDEASYLMFGGITGLNPEDWELTDTY